MENVASLEDHVDDDQLQKIVDRVRKLLALSEGGGGEHESNAALGQAQALMLKYSIDAARLDPGQKLMQTNVATGSRFQAWQIKLANVVAHFNGCMTLYEGKGSRGEKHLRFYGKKADLIAARYMHGFILSEMDFLVKNMGGTAVFKNPYRDGLIDGVALALHKAKKKVYEDLNKENVERGIVKVESDDRQAQAQKMIEEHMGHELATFNQKSQAKQNATAHAMGKAHGQLIDPSRNAGGLEKPNEQLND